MVLGDSSAHRRFWNLMDRLAKVFWQASRRGVKLPLACIEDLLRAVRALGVAGLPLTRYLRWTVGDALAAHGLTNNTPPVGLLAMLIKDTVHSTVDRAPLVNAALGITTRGAGLTRAKGGIRGFSRSLATHYRAMGGQLKVGGRVERITGTEGSYVLQTQRGQFHAQQVVSTLPAPLTARIGPASVARRLRPFLDRDGKAPGGAIVVFLGVPDAEVAGQRFTGRPSMPKRSWYTGLGYGANPRALGRRPC